MSWVSFHSSKNGLSGCPATETLLKPFSGQQSLHLLAPVTSWTLPASLLQPHWPPAPWTGQAHPWQRTFVLGGLCLDTTWFTPSLPSVSAHHHLVIKVFADFPSLPCPSPLPSPPHALATLFCCPPPKPLAMFTCLLTASPHKRVNIYVGRKGLGLFCSLIMLCVWHIEGIKEIFFEWLSDKAIKC